MLASSGERIPPCGVPDVVSSRSPTFVMMPDFRNAFTSAQTRLSLILTRRRSINAVCEISSKQGFDICLQHPVTSFGAVGLDLRDRVLRPAFRAEPIRARLEIRLE